MPSTRIYDKKVLVPEFFILAERKCSVGVTFAQVEYFFFEAMQNGYAGGGKKTRVLDMPGFWEIEFNRGDWRCVDRWGGPENSLFSAGTTTIWHEDVPVWFMTYGGWYDSRAIEILKVALRGNYIEKIFAGCRGPRSLKMLGCSLVYTNQFRGTFANFSGQESVTHLLTNQPLGHHNYAGICLFS